MVRRNGTHGAVVEERAPAKGHNRLDPYLAQREGTRQIKVRSTRRTAAGVSEAVVKTTAGLPDMRFAENQNKFKIDPLKRVDGSDDRRFLENRPEILELHEARGQGRPNVIFNDDGEITA